MTASLLDFYRNKKVLITGHTGFKGSWLSLWLSEIGSEVIGFSLDSPTSPSHFEICGLKNRMVSIRGDIRDLGALRRVVSDYSPEVVFHLAAQSLVRRSYREPVDTFGTNVMGTVNLLEACRQASSVRVVINVTSDKCYENKEWVWGYRENDAIGGHDPYSSSKGCAELVTTAYARSYLPEAGQPSTRKALASVRAGNVIGGGDWAEDRLIPDCIKALCAHTPIIVRNPLSVRPWQHVLEPLYGYLVWRSGCMPHRLNSPGAWNFGSNDDSFITVGAMVEQVVQQWGGGEHRLPPRPGPA